MPAPDQSPPPPTSLPAALAAAPSVTPPTEHGPAVPFWFMPVAMLFLVLATWLAYANSFHAAFSLDNALVLNGDTRLREWEWQDHLRLIFFENYWYPSFPSELFRPLTTITYAANWSLFKNLNDPFGYHVVNFLLHAANASLVLIVARRLTGRAWLALLAAAIFALHPVEVESITNVIGRADELATFWILVGFWCYLRATGAGVLTRPLWLLGLMFAATCAMFSKETGFMLGALLVLYDFIFRWPKLVGPLGNRLGTAVYEFFLKGWAVLVPPIVFFFVIRKILFVASPIYGELFIDNPIARAEWFSGRMTAFKVLARYVGLMIYPATLSCDYSYNQVPLFGEGAPLWEDIQCWLGLALVLTLLGFAWFRRREQPLFSFGVFFFFGMQALTCNVFFPIGSIMAERFLYLPSIGFCLVAALALRWLGERVAALLTLATPARAWAGLALPLVLLMALGLRTHARNTDWATESDLWESAVAAAPNSFKVHKGRANGYWNTTHSEDGIDKAIARAEVGLAVIDSKPLSAQRQDNTLFCDLGMYYNIKAEFLNARKEPTEARRFYQKGVDVMIRAKDVDTWVNQASREAQKARGRKDEEIPDVGNPRVHLQLAQSYLGLLQFTEAAKSATYAAHLSPLNPQAYLMLGIARANTPGQLDSSAVALIEALMVDATNEQVWNPLKQVYAMLGQTSAISDGPPNGGHQMNISVPAVRSHINRASAEIIQGLIDEKEYDQAKVFRDRAIDAKGGYGCPPEVLPVVPAIPKTEDIWARLHNRLADWFRPRPAVSR